MSYALSVDLGGVGRPKWVKLGSSTASTPRILRVSLAPWVRSSPTSPNGCLGYGASEGFPTSYLRAGDLHLLRAFGTVGNDDIRLTGENRPDDRLRNVA